MPKQRFSFAKVLFKRKRPDEGMEEAGNVSLKEIPEDVLPENCEPLTIGQQCADWFVLRQLRVVGTNAGVILMSNREVRSTLGISTGGNQDKSPNEWFELFFNSPLSSKVSKEDMNRIFANEDAVLSTISSLSLVEEVFEACLA